MDEMIICAECKTYKGEDRCRHKGAPSTNTVTGTKKCSIINKNGNCIWFRRSSRGLVFGIIGIVCIIAVLVGASIGIVKYANYREAMAYQKQVDQVNMVEDARIAETEIRRAEQEAKVIAEEKAKLPVKIYKGTYAGKEFIINEYHPIR